MRPETSSGTPAPEIRVRPLSADDHPWADQLLAHYQGSRMTARLGELTDPLTLPGLVAERRGERIGLVTYRHDGDELELLTVHSHERGRGAGWALMEASAKLARGLGAARMWLVTTNDNLAAIRFYLRRGMHVAAVHTGAMSQDRQLKPSIPMTNAENGIAIRDLVEFAVDPQSWTGRTTPLPSAADLDALPPEACQAELAPLFEGAPRFVARLAAARPFGDDAGLIGAAYRIVRDLPEGEAVELVNSHPRIGSDPAAMSRMSQSEQGYGANAGEPSWVDEELGGLNDVYEDRFGFRYVTFVAGRPREQVIPLLEASLRNDRDAELRRAVSDCVAIAEDRLRVLRAQADPAAGEEPATPEDEA
jgi:2-oxo-4-hydroxy-4-carboxy--5-ureidoimidazoline (OHCU) decarboxylase/GNAT superfamily N-acetyltransferase